MKYNAPEFPKRIEIELASSCNLRCIYCPRHYVDNLNGFIDLDLFKKLISEIEKYPDTVLVLHRRGESLLHPEFKEIFNAVSGYSSISDITFLNISKSINPFKLST